MQHILSRMVERLSPDIAESLVRLHTGMPDHFHIFLLRSIFHFPEYLARIKNQGDTAARECRYRKYNPAKVKEFINQRVNYEIHLIHGDIQSNFEVLSARLKHSPYHHIIQGPDFWRLQQYVRGHEKRVKLEDV